jgi:hypothetical protein
MASRRIGMGRAFFVVGALALLVFVGASVLAERERDRWDAESMALMRENVGSGQAWEPPPDEPLLVQYETPIAIGAALVVAVVGSVIVLLSAIVARLR